MSCGSPMPRGEQIAKPAERATRLAGSFTAWTSTNDAEGNAMNSYLAKRGLGTLALPLAVVVALAPAGFTSCGDKATGPSGGPPTYQGVFAGGTGESGVLKVRVPAGNPPDVTGSLTFVGGGDVNLTGTLDQSTGALSLIGGGYTITGNVVTGGLDGKYTGPAGSGQFTTLKNSTNSVRVFCGTYSGVDPGTRIFFDGIWNLTQSGDTLVGAGVGVVGDSNTFLLKGTLQGNTVRLTASSGRGTSTTTGTLSGNSVSGGDANETWQATTDACYFISPITITPKKDSVNFGRTLQLTATIKDANGNPLLGAKASWSSSNTSVATVDQTGLVTPVVDWQHPPPPPPPGFGATTVKIAASDRVNSDTAIVLVGWIYITNEGHVTFCSTGNPYPNVTASTSLDTATTKTDASGHFVLVTKTGTTGNGTISYTKFFSAPSGLSLKDGPWVWGGLNVGENYCFAY